MFITNLTVEQQSAFLYFAEELMHVDGEQSVQEATAFELYKDQISLDTSAKSLSKVELVTLFNTTKSKLSMILELIGLAHIDGNYDVTEKDYLGSLASVLGLPKRQLEQCEAWVEKQLELMAEANKLLEG